MTREQYICDHEWTNLGWWHCHKCFLSRSEWREFQAGLSDKAPPLPPLDTNKNWEREHGLPQSYPGYNPEHCLVSDPKPKTFTNGTA